MRKGKLEFEPGAHWAYSSTNFVLAGLLLARLSNATRWDAYGQAALLSPLPAQRRSSYALDFASHGTPAAHGAVRGFDRTSYNGANASARPGVDVSDVAGPTPSRDPAEIRPRSSRDPAEMQARSSRDPAETQARRSRDAGETQPRCRRDAAEIQASYR